MLNFSIYIYIYFKYNNFVFLNKTVFFFLNKTETLNSFQFIRHNPLRNKKNNFCNLKVNFLFLLYYLKKKKIIK